MRSALEELDLLYRRLGFIATPTATTLSVEKQIAGRTHRTRFHHLGSPDPDSVIALAQKLQDTEGAHKEETVIIVDSEVSPDIAEFFSELADGPHTIESWLNKVVRARELCNRLLEITPGFSRSFVTPVVEPISFADLSDWITSDQPEETLGHLVLLLGPAGFGKTTATTRLASIAATRHLQNPSSPVPVLLSLEQFRGARSWEDLLSAFSRSMEMSEITPAALKFLIDRNRVVVLVDGLDEMAERGGIGAATETLQELSQITQTGKLLVSARDSYLGSFQSNLSFQNVSIAHIRGVDQGEIATLLEGRRDTTIRTVASILKACSDGSDDLTNNPLLMFILAELVEQDSSSVASLEADAAKSAIGLLARALELVHRRESDRQAIGLSPEDYEELFGEMAVEAIRRGYDGADEDPLVVPKGIELVRSWIALRISDEQQLASTSKTSREKRLLQSLTSHLLIQVSQHASETKLMFRHPFFRDAAAAQWVRRRLAQGHAHWSVLELGSRTADYVAGLLSEQSIADLLQKIDHRAPGFGLIIHAATSERILSSEEDTRRSRDLLTDWQHVVLDGATVRQVVFENVSFSGSSMNHTEFFRCRFIQADFAGASIPNIRFNRCTADRRTVNFLRSAGVVELPSMLEDPSQDRATDEVTDAERFARDVLTSLFKRFVRDQRGTHQRSAKKAAFVRGLRQDESDFTSTHLIEIAKKHRIISESSAFEVYKFNSEYQRAADCLIFDGTIDESLHDVYEETLSRVGRFLG